jgi:hypothetical protein
VRRFEEGEELPCGVTVYGGSVEGSIFRSAGSSWTVERLHVLQLHTVTVRRPEIGSVRWLDDSVSGEGCSHWAGGCVR